MEMVDDGMTIFRSFNTQSRVADLRPNRLTRSQCHTQVKGATTINPPTEVACLRRKDTHNQDSESKVLR